MNKSRLEAFSDGVLAIIITVMLLEMKTPRGADLAALRPMLPVLLSYLLSFVYVGIYWNNHHHLLHAARSINGKIMWANLHLLFWLSLVPFATAWLGENPGQAWPAALYGLLLLLAAAAYTVLQAAILAHEGKDSKLGRALGSDLKDKLSPVIYILGIGFSFASAWVGYAAYILVALMWLVPDPRIESKIKEA
jgi:uncharacterized membrane protein